jgi:hypothetical protein
VNFVPAPRPVSNTQDFQHVAVMPGATMEHEPAAIEYGEFTVEFENDVHQHFKLFGTNTLAQQADDAADRAAVAVQRDSDQRR